MKKQTGITLISLVVTIIVLIILVGVSINLILGQDGIIGKAREAKQEIAEIKEKLGLDILDAHAEALTRNEKLEQSQLEDIISNYGDLQEDKDTIILKDNKGTISLLDVYKGTTTTTGSYTDNKAKIQLLESEIELLKNQKEELQKQLEDFASSEGDNAQKIVELTEEIQIL